MDALFSALAASRAPARTGPPANELCRLKAGKCTAVKVGERNYRVTPDKHPGFIRLEKTMEGFVKFVWLDKNAGADDRDFLALYPGDGQLKKVKTGNPTDRVYLLHIPPRFEHSPPVMFWLQDKDPSTDAANITQINNFLNGIAPPPALAPGQVDFSSLISQFSVPAATASASSTATTNPLVPPNNSTPMPPTPPLSSSGGGGAGGHFTAADFRRIAQQQRQSLSLEDIVTAEGIVASGILQDPAVRAQLIALLPENQRTDAFLEENIRSPQFRQSLEALGHALQTDNYNSVLANFGLNPQAGADSLMAGDSVSAFLSSVQSQADQDKRSEGETTSNASSSTSMNIDDTSGGGGASGEGGNNSDPKPPPDNSDKKGGNDDSSMEQ